MSDIALEITGEPAITAEQRRCKNCECFQPPAPATDGRDPIAAAAAGMHFGWCFLNPAAVRKLPDEFCFQFMPKEAADA